MLTHLPAGFGSLRLRSLKLSYNRLETLRPGVFRPALKGTLTQLWLSNNNLLQLPDSLIEVSFVLPSQFKPPVLSTDNQDSDANYEKTKPRYTINSSTSSGVGEEGRVVFPRDLDIVTRFGCVSTVIRTGQRITINGGGAAAVHIYGPPGGHSPVPCRLRHAYSLCSLPLIARGWLGGHSLCSLPHVVTNGYHLQANITACSLLPASCVLALLTPTYCVWLVGWALTLLTPACCGQWLPPSSESHDI